ncbi:unnamed protein product, partial [Heterotrigona itama]
EANRTRKTANFEAAIAAAGHGKFQYLLLLAIIPVSWATSIDTSSIAIILPSAECDLQMTFFQKGVLNAVMYIGPCKHTLVVNMIFSHPNLKIDRDGHYFVNCAMMIVVHLFATKSRERLVCTTTTTSCLTMVLNLLAVCNN